MRSSWLPKVILACLDLALVNLSLLFAYWLRFHAGLGFEDFPVAPFNQYVKALVVVDYLVLLLFLQFGLYKEDAAQTLISEWNAILKAVALAVLILISLSFFYREFSYSRLVSVYTWFLASFLLCALRYLLRQRQFRRRRKGKGLRGALLIGHGEMAGIAAERFDHNATIGYKLLAYLTGTGEGTSPYLDEKRRAGTSKDLAAAIERFHPEEVFVADPGLAHYDLLDIVDLCESRKIPVTLIPSIYDLLIDFTDVSTLDGIPFVSLEEFHLSEPAQALKRVFDVVFSLGILLTFWPVALAIALAIRRGSPGPVIFRQRRAGLNGKPFTMFKFRTMVPDAEERLPGLVTKEALQEPVFKLKNDPRVTKAGRFLRRTSLDELPQFLNVLFGQMSVVGPRPEEVSLVAEYNVWQKRRLKMKPGITGLQQISARGSESLSERVKFDIFYMRRYSFLLDLVIIARTVWVVITGKGAY